MMKHRFIALRFIPRDAYEKSAPLDIHPKPDIVTRVFMLFRGAAEYELANWGEAHERAKEPVSFWNAVVGVDTGKQADTSLFRVLEWGGMEVV